MSLSSLVIATLVGLQFFGSHGHCKSTSGSSTPEPLAFNPSLFWDGDGGHWSSFALRIGTPPQTVRLIPSIAGDSINPIWTYACSQTFPDWDNCTQASGMTFTNSSSSTYNTSGDYYLPLTSEANLNLGNFSTQLGFDNISLDYSVYSNISLSNASIFADLNDSFSIGTFGLWQNTTYFDSEYNTPIPTFLRSLRDANLIPSLSWGYLAGAAYRYGWPTSAYASLTLGGYDKSRMNLTSGRLTLAGGDDPNRKYLLGIDRIETTGGKVLLDDPITSVLLDSQVVSIWLPISVCHAFEDAFGLVWNSTYNMYLMDDDQYNSLKELNPNITFTLSTGVSSNAADTLNITLPYAAFDLETVPPIDGKTFKYFPLNRSLDDTQYTLGRVILQETYMVADWEHNAISLYKGVYPNASVASELVPICPVNSTTCKSPESSGGNKLSGGDIAGIVIGSVAGAILIILAILGYFWWRKRKRALGKSEPATSARNSVGTVAGTIASTAAGTVVDPVTGTAAGTVSTVVEKPELDASTPFSSPSSRLNGRDEIHGHKSELSGDSGYTSQNPLTGSGSGSNPRDSRSVGMVADSDRSVELSGAGSGSGDIQELGNGTHRSKRRSELPGSPGPVRYELPGSTPEL